MSQKSSGTGRGIMVAVLDTGAFPHLDFKDRMDVFVDFVGYGNAPYDDNGHGTHVCGIIGGSGEGCGGLYQGMAVECRLMVIKVLDAYGNGKKNVILQSFRWILENQKKYGIRVVNISVGTTCNTKSDHRELIEGVDAMWDAGITVVAAAGNRGPMPGSITAPGSSRKIITVGCSDSLQKLREASGRGPTHECISKPDIVAPGYEIMSCCPYYDGNPAYTQKSGTSMSTPYVSGTIAQLLEKDPKLTNVEIKMLLRDRAVDLNLPHNLQGWGFFDRNLFLEGF